MYRFINAGEPFYLSQNPLNLFLVFFLFGFRVTEVKKTSLRSVYNLAGAAGRVVSSGFIIEIGAAVPFATLRVVVTIRWSFPLLFI